MTGGGLVHISMRGLGKWTLGWTLGHCQITKCYFSYGPIENNHNFYDLFSARVPWHEAQPPRILHSSLRELEQHGEQPGRSLYAISSRGSRATRLKSLNVPWKPLRRRPSSNSSRPHTALTSMCITCRRRFAGPPVSEGPEAHAHSPCGQQDQVLVLGVRPPCDKTIVLAEQVQLRVVREEEVTARSILDYYKALHILADGYAIVAQHKVTSKEDASKEVLSSPISDNIRYPDTLLRIPCKALADLSPPAMLEFCYRHAIVVGSKKGGGLASPQPSY